MDRRLYEKDDTEAGLRAAQRLGGNEPAIAKARIAHARQGRQQGAARRRAGRRPQRHRLQVRPHPDAAPRRPARRSGGAAGDHPQAARRQPRPRRMVDRAPPAGAQAARRRRSQERLSSWRATPRRRPATNYRAEHQFTAGWIALRYLNDPDDRLRALQARSPKATRIRSRWRAAPTGRAAPPRRCNTAAGGAHATTRRRRAIRPPITARSPAPRPASASSTLNPLPGAVRRGARQARASPTWCAPPNCSTPSRPAIWPGRDDGRPRRQVERRRHAGRCWSELDRQIPGRARHAAGRQARAGARPCRSTTPPSRPSACRTTRRSDPTVEPALVYSIVRQESWFNPKTVSSANALGLMQVTPAAGKYLAKKFNVTFDQKRLLSDNVYNVQMGAAELGDVIKDYRGSYIMAFAAYNAGRGRVRDWVGQLRRSARSQGRSDRLGRAHPVLGDAQLRAARDGKRAGLSRPLRRQPAAADRGRPAARLAGGELAKPRSRAGC